jgi:hypothetical protein
MTKTTIWAVIGGALKDRTRIVQLKRKRPHRKGSRGAVTEIARAGRERTMTLPRTQYQRMRIAASVGGMRAWRMGRNKLNVRIEREF